MKIGSLISKIAVLSAILVAAGCETTPPTIQSGPTAEVSFDGLNKVDNPQAQAAWARPDLDLSGYSKLLLVSAGFEYAPAKNRGRTQIEKDRGGPYVIEDDVRVRFEKEVGDQFREAFEKIQNWEVVTEKGPDVLAVYGGLGNIQSDVPPDDYNGMSNMYITSVGQATLLLDLRDSESNTILARSIDARLAERMGGQMFESNRVTNGVEVRRLAGFWADRLVASLDSFKEISTGN